jgi:hypothetical protein
MNLRRLRRKWNRLHPETQKAIGNKVVGLLAVANGAASAYAFLM